MKFTFDSYIAALDLAVTEGFAIINALRYVESIDRDTLPKRFVVMRHDCERDLEKAIRLADLEAEAGFSTSYFVRMHSEYYNLSGSTDRARVRALVARGHDVGLHYEPAFYDSDGTDFLVGLERDVRCLSEITGILQLTTRRR